MSEDEKRNRLIVNIADLIDMHVVICDGKPYAPTALSLAESIVKGVETHLTESKPFNPHSPDCEQGW